MSREQRTPAGTHPGSALQLMLKKAAIFWEAPELSSEKYIYFFWGNCGPRQYARTAQDIYTKLGTVLYERGRCREAADALGRVHPGASRCRAGDVLGLL
jgi:hypothetical protein